MNFLAVFEHHSLRRAVFDQNPRDRSLRTNFSARFPRRLADRIRNSAGAAAAESPRSECPVDLAHIVMQQHVRAARASECPETCR